MNTHELSGGASRAMHRLHQGFKIIGVDSTIICTKKKSNDTSVFGVDSEFNLNNRNWELAAKSEIIQEYIINHRTDYGNTIFSFPYPDWDISNHLKIKNSDVINLHWVAYFLSAQSIEKLIQLKKPIVWTLHDEWAYTGGCHYTAGCVGFISNCENCPQLSKKNSIIPKYVLNEKIKILENKITIISPSKWLANQAKKSALFQNSRVEIIPNSLDTETFKPINKLEAKAHWNISPDTFTILFGAENGNEKRKGFGELLEALKILLVNQNWQKILNENKILILIFGSPAKDIKNLGIPYKCIGHTKEDSLLALAYSAADLFILPSLEDNLPNTMLESLSCETPIVAFNVGGISDVVIPDKTGYLAEYANPKSLALKILEALENPGKRINLGKEGRLLMENEFSLPKQASRYNNLFQDLLIEKSRRIEKLPNLISREINKSVFEEAYSNSQDFFIKTYSEYKRLKFTENLNATSAQIFFSDLNEFDFTKGIQLTLDVTNNLELFNLRFYTHQVYDLHSGHKHLPISPTGVTILPSLRNPFQLYLEKVILIKDNREEIEINLERISGNWTLKQEKMLFFYHGHGNISILFSEEDIIGVHLVGRWRLFTTYEAFCGINKILEDYNKILEEYNKILEEYNKIIYKILYIIVFPFEYFLKSFNRFYKIVKSIIKRLLLKSIS